MKCRACSSTYACLPACPVCDTPTVASVTEPAPTDQYLARCRGCGQWKDRRVPCPHCAPDARCYDCRHPMREHSSEPEVGCLNGTAGPIWYGCPCALPGTSQADQ